MEYNFLMQRCLCSIDLNRIIPDSACKVWEAYTLDGNPFWCAGSFCGIDTSRVTLYGRELTDLEWAGNEIFLQGCNVLEQALSVYRSIKIQLQQNFPDMEFDLLVSADIPRQTANVRFWAVRDGYHYIEPSCKNLNDFQTEAVLIDRVNRTDTPREVASFLALFSKYQPAVAKKNPDEIQVTLKNPMCGEDITIYFTDEATMVFSRFHAHYSYGDEELRHDVEAILSGEYAVIYIESDGKWLGSTLTAPAELPRTSQKKLLGYLLGRSKDSIRQIKEKGGRLTIIYWDPGRCMEYTLKAADTRK